MATMLSTRTHEPLSGGGGSGAGGSNKRLSTHHNPNPNSMEYLDPANDQDAADDRAIAKLLNGDPMEALEFTAGGVFTVNDDGAEQEKAENAVDYEDIDEVADEDDDLLDMDVGDGEVQVKMEEGIGGEGDEMGGLFGEEGFGGEEGGDMDGLFDEEFEMRQIETVEGADLSIDHHLGNDIMKSGHYDDAHAMKSFGSEEATQEDNFDDLDLGDLDQPRELTKQEELALYWPDFRPHTVLNFNKLIPIKEAKYPTTLSKHPKILLPTKVTLEPAVDTQRSFLRPGPGKVRGGERGEGVIYTQIEAEEGEEERGQKEAEKEDFNEAVQRDIEMCCDDWEAKVFPSSPAPESVEESRLRREREEDDDLEYEIDIRPTKVSEGGKSGNCRDWKKLTWSGVGNSGQSCCIVIWRTYHQIGWIWKISVMEIFTYQQRSSWI